MAEGFDVLQKKLSTIVAHKVEREAQAESFLYLKRRSWRHGKKGYGLGVL
jgi:hypothetical protein